MEERTSLFERSTPPESAMPDERALVYESTALYERAERAERTMPPERANTYESYSG